MPDKEQKDASELTVEEKTKFFEDQIKAQTPSGQVNNKKSTSEVDSVSINDSKKRKRDDSQVLKDKKIKKTKKKTKIIKNTKVNIPKVKIPKKLKVPNKEIPLVKDPIIKNEVEQGKTNTNISQETQNLKEEQKVTTSFYSALIDKVIDYIPKPISDFVGSVFGFKNAVKSEKNNDPKDYKSFEKSDSIANKFEVPKSSGEVKGNKTIAEIILDSTKGNKKKIFGPSRESIFVENEKLENIGKLYKTSDFSQKNPMHEKLDPKRKELDTVINKKIKQKLEDKDFLTQVKFHIKSEGFAPKTNPLKTPKRKSGPTGPTRE